MKWRHRTAKFLAGIGGGASPPLLPLLCDETVYDLATGGPQVYPLAIDREPGRTVTFKPTSSGGTYMSGWDINQLGGLDSDAFLVSGTAASVLGGASIGEVPTGSEQTLAVTLRTSGSFFLVGDALLYRSDDDSSTPLYAGWISADATGSMSQTCVPKTLWAPTPTAADTGTVVPAIEDAGSNGLDGTAVDVGLGGPGVGAYFDDTGDGYILVDSTSQFTIAKEFTVAVHISSPTSWVESTDSNAFSLRSGDTYYIRNAGASSVLSVAYLAGGVSKSRTIPYPVADECVIGSSTSYSGDTHKVYLDGSTVPGGSYTGLGEWTSPLSSNGFRIGTYHGYSFSRNYHGNIRDLVVGYNQIDEATYAVLAGHVAASTVTDSYLASIFPSGYQWYPMDELYATDGGDLTGIEAGGEGAEWAGPTWANTVDGAVNAPVDADDYYRATDVGSPYAYIEAKWTIGADGSGAVACLDSATSPANLIQAKHDGTNVVVEKLVGGTPTTLATIAATYSANAPLVLRTLPNDTAGIDWWCLYNGAYIANGTVTDAGIIDNTLHGPFSTSSDNVRSNVEIFPANGHQPPGA